MRQVMNPEQLTSALAALPRWSLLQGELVQSFEFTGFQQAMEFVNQVAKLAEDANHHPDIDIRYNRVRLALVTHDAGGITKNDIEMAEKIDRTSEKILPAAGQP